MRYVALDEERQVRIVPAPRQLSSALPSVRGALVQGRREGSWIRRHEDGTKAEEATYRQGQLHGPVTLWYATGKVKAELHYERGRLHGPWAAWHPNGEMAEEGEWIAGLPHRDYIRFWPNGRRRLTGSFEHGVPVEVWRVFSQQGALMYEGGWDPDLEAWLTPRIKAGVRPARVLARTG